MLYVDDDMFTAGSGAVVLGVYGRGNSIGFGIVQRHAHPSQHQSRAKVQSCHGQLSSSEAEKVLVYHEYQTQRITIY